VIAGYFAQKNQFFAPFIKIYHGKEMASILPYFYVKSRKVLIKTFVYRNFVESKIFKNISH